MILRDNSRTDHIMHMNWTDLCTVRAMGNNMWPSGLGVRFNINRSGVRFPLLVMSNNVGQTSHSIMSVYPAAMGTWWNEESKLPWLAIAAAKCESAEFSQKRMRLCSNTRMYILQPTDLMGIPGLWTCTFTVIRRVLCLQAVLMTLAREVHNVYRLFMWPRP